MNITNEDALDVMVAIGRQALERGKVDQALTILSGVLSKAPNHALAWFSLGRAHLLTEAHDHAAMCYSRAATLARTQRGVPANMLALARDNMVLCGERVLPRDWLPALQDPHLAERWGAALGALAAAAAEGRHRSVHAFVVGGIGLQALQLHALLAAASSAAAQAAAAEPVPVPVPPASSTSGKGEVEAAAAEAAEAQPQPAQAEPAAAGGSQPAAAGVSVTLVQADELSRTLVAQMAAAAGVPSSELRAINGWKEAAAAAVEAQPMSVPERPQDQGRLGLLVVAGVCTARLALREWAAALAQARPLLAPGALLCPRAARLVGVLVASEDLRAMNEVRVDWMAEDSGGLEYGQANELLWRPARSMQVSTFSYSLLSEPFPLLPEVNAEQLLLQPEQVLGAAAAAADGAAVRPAAAAARRHDVAVFATSSGRADCVVCWMEYELTPGVWLSYAPHEMQGRSDSPALSPHVWQRVQYLSARPAAEQGQQLVLQVTLSGGGDELRVEYDEDVTAVQQPAGLQLGGAAGAGAGGAAAGSDDGADWGLPPGEALLPAGECLDGNDDSDEDGATEEDAATNDGDGVSGSGANGVALAAAAAAQSGIILPYHMSMLNDRVRTRCYVRGIQAAVAEAQARHPEQPLVVLDVGSGTGLLSMAAARAGAECVVGCERELALAVAAGALTAANGLTSRVSLVQAHSRNLRVAQQQQQQQETHAAGSEAGSGGDAAAAAAARPQSQPEEPPGAHLPRRAGLVVHEIFGTDPLSEHILPSMAQVQESLAAPDAVYLPSAFCIVAALAHSELLEGRMRSVRPPLPGAPGAGQAEGTAAAAARLQRVLPPAAAAALQPWAPWKAELDLLRVPDLVLLSEPTEVSSLRLDTRPLPRAYRSAATAAPCCPTPLAQLFTRHGPGGEELPAEPPAAAAAVTAANCIVYWFEADCGAGGRLSTCPGSASTYFGHWAQNAQFLDEPLPVPDPGALAAGVAAGLRVRLSAECILDRVRLAAEWVQAGDDSSSSSSSSSGDEGAE